MPATAGAAASSTDRMKQYRVSRKNRLISDSTRCTM